MTRHGLTLIEVLAAAALFAITVGALVPLLRDAQNVGRVDTSALDLFELSRTADVLMRGIDPEAVESLSPTERSLPWPGDPVRGPILVTATVHTDEYGRYAWVVFEHHDLAVARWVRLPEAQR